jgi:hypothetical protein
VTDNKQVPRGQGRLEFIINEDGSVTFIKLPPEMIEVARALDPDATLACDIGTEESNNDD